VERGAWQPDCNVLISAKGLSETDSVKNIFSKKVRTCLWEVAYRVHEAEDRD
jgi:hypothetical protein